MTQIKINTVFGPSTQLYLAICPLSNISLAPPLTKVDIGNGMTTAFWLDLWFKCSTENLATIFPALFSHTLRPAATVARVLGYPALNLDLAPRLTHAAELELGNLRAILAFVSLNLQVMDKRT